ncbi:MAG: class I SAM-dependent methyltransferase [Acidimicrobiales bacterium]|nr:class I SAM-dependent methyltransferase [Acidimicrobiales bacterium]
MDAAYPDGFFDRADPSDDARFYEQPRLLTHIDDAAIAAVGALYAHLGLGGTTVLDLMSSWVSHFHPDSEPKELTVLGMNADELAANPLATRAVVRDINVEPTLPFDDASFDHATCCVSVDYLTQPVAVFREVARVLRPGGWFVVTFSNRLFPTKAIRGWRNTDSVGHCRIVESYFANAGGFDEPTAQLRTPITQPGDPLFGVFARRAL